MKYKELKAKLNSMTDAQLDWPAVVFEEDNEMGHEIDCVEESQEDFYWFEGDLVGNKDQVDEMIKEDADLTIGDFTIVPKGTVTLHYNLTELEKIAISQE